LRHVIFTLEGERYGVLLSKVRTVVMTRSFTRIPRAPKAMLGIMNLRGRVVSVVDLATLLGLAPGSHPGKILLLDRGRTELGVAVTDVLGIAPLEPQGRAPEGSPGFVTAVARDDHGAVTLLDADALDTQVNSLFPQGG
jgi:purine-binding chemotaxis protein CheW